MEIELAFSRKKYIAVLWDIDGTLIDSEPLHDEAVIETLRHMGFGDVGTRLDMLGTTWDRIWREVGGDLTQLDAFEKGATEFYLGRLSTLKPRPKALEWVQRFHRWGVKQAAVSNSRKSIVEANIRQLGLNDFIGTLVSRDDCQNAKPHPEPYLNAAKMMEIDIRSCIAVEDSARGATAAKTAGALSLFWPQNEFLEAKGCDIRILDLDDFPWQDYLGSSAPGRNAGPHAG